MTQFGNATAQSLSKHCEPHVAVPAVWMLLLDPSDAALGHGWRPAAARSDMLARQVELESPRSYLSILNLIAFVAVNMSGFQVHSPMPCPVSYSARSNIHCWTYDSFCLPVDTLRIKPGRRQQLELTMFQMRRVSQTMLHQMRVKTSTCRCTRGLRGSLLVTAQ